MRGTEGQDRLTVDLSETILEALPVTFDGGGGEDTLEGPGADVVWRIDGQDTGLLLDLRFEGVENLLGASGNEDTFVLAEGGSLSGLLDGGPGGFDTLVIEGGVFDTVRYAPTGADSGIIDLDGNVLRYAGLEPISNQGTSTDVVFDLTGSDDDAVIEAGSGGTAYRIRSVDSGFELTGFDAPTGSLTINGGEGDDSVTIAADLNLGTADLAINAETITVNSGVSVTADDITFTAEAVGGGLLDSFLQTIRNALGTDMGLNFDQAVIADAAASVNVTGATLEGTNITLNASSTMDLDTDGFSLSNFHLAVLYE
ncbi:MAG: hypothetical protein JRJ83_18660, partial [Deltaproteobacteria bacterium]|nr:hypothetical protein [Deltaproteobacteria bacterium]